MKYIEFGIGNTWLVRTEFEEADKDYECQGIVGPLIPVGYYFRLWIGKSVFIISTNEGFKQTKKKHNTFKFIFGIQSKLKKDN